ncbi:helix-turn-helix domain-containing protein [Lachnotalea sp. AF33-28]|nr:helix-turn-helix domain-containing protein [Lachnotalea sp. AF33-28]
MAVIMRRKRGITGPMNIMIVDDEQPAIEGLLHLIDWQSYGFEHIYTARSMTEAMGVLKEDAVEIMICDIEMPGGSGIDLLKWVREHCCEMEVVLLTAYENFSYAKDAVSYGCLEYLLKPPVPEELKAVLNRAVEKIAQQEEALRYRQYGQDIQLWELTEDRENVTLPDFPLWTKLLLEKQQKALCQEVDAYERILRAREGLKTGFLLHLHEDFLQMLYSALTEKGIQAHQLLDNGDTARLSVRSVAGITDMFLWIRHVLKLAASYIEEVEKTDTVMGKIRRYVSQHLADEDLSRGDIAGYVYLNPDYLTRIVKKETGLPISEYIQRERMEAAMKLIDKTELSISSVAAEVGYQHFSHFSKVFRKHTGMSPMEYRSRQK